MRLAPLTSALALACATAAQAQPQEEGESPSVRYLFGGALATQPEYDGSAQRKTKFKPLWAVRFGRWRISTSGAGGLLGFGQEESAGGASTQFVDTAHLRMGVALRMDSGRSSSDAGVTRGLPDVQRTLRARLYASYSLAKDLTLGANLSQDILGHHGGMTFDTDLGWRFYRSKTLEWTGGIGLSGGNAQNLRSYFGVPESAAAASGKPAYAPGGGLRDIHAGAGFVRPLDPHWLLYGSAGASHPLGPVADSPLAGRRVGVSAAVGLAWRN